MGVDRGYVARNDTERARLRSLIAGMSDARLGDAMPGDWTVAGVLAHLAFWDQRVLAVLERWERGGAPPPPPNAADVDWINDTAKPLVLALPPRRAAEIALAVAEAVDRKLETLPDDLVERNTAAGSPLNFTRADHQRRTLIRCSPSPPWTCASVAGTPPPMSYIKPGIKSVERQATVIARLWRPLERQPSPRSDPAGWRLR